MALEAFVGSVQGQQGGRHPRFVSNQGYEKAFNVTRRFVLPQTRPGRFQRALSFPSEFIQNVFEKGKFQGAYEYVVGCVSYLAVTVDGNLFLIDSLSGCVFDLSGKVGRLSKQVDRVFYVQANEFLIVQDGINRPIIAEGTAARRSDPNANEVPIGTFMTYGENRLFVVPATDDGAQILAGDIFISQDRESILNFTENIYLATGGSLSGGAFLGRITGLRFLPSLDDSTGLGGLIASHERGLFAYNVSIPRAQWGDQPIGRAIAFESGATSQEAFIPIDNDLYFRGFDEVRSLSQARADFNRFGNLRISAEMEEFTSLDTQWLLDRASMAYFENRMFVTTIPRRRVIDFDGDTRVDVIHKGLMVMDFDGSNGITSSNAPVWEGVWTGLDVTQVLKTVSRGQDQLFLFAKDSNNNNVLFEQSRDDFVDRTLDTESLIQSRIYLKAYDFDSPFTTKQLEKAKIWLTQVRGEYKLDAYFRANDYNPWFEWGGTAEGTSTMGGCISDDFITIDTSCGEPEKICIDPVLNCEATPPGQEQSRSNITLGSASNTDGKVSDVGLVSQGEEFQPRIDWSGSLQISKILFEAEQAPQSDSLVSDDEACDRSLRFCPVNDFEYSVI